MQKIRLERRCLGPVGLAWAASGLVLAGAAWWMWGGGEAATATGALQAEASAAGAFPWMRSAPDGAGEAFTPESVAAQQAAAASAVAAQVRLVQDEELITQRPTYVSEFEWVALQMAARQHEQPQQELTRLVHYLGFMKQVELWRSLPSTADAVDQRRALAQELLRLLPRRLAQKDVDPAEAQQWQAAWQADAALVASATH